MQSIVLPDETRYAEQMRSEVLPALAACSQRIPCTGEGGAALNVRLYAPAGAQRSIVLSHGFCESEEKLRELSWLFLQQGYAVLAYDHRGHGFSARKVADPSVVHVQDFDDYVLDLARVVEAARPHLPPGRPALFGHSMGGGIAARALELYPDLFCRCVLHAPMIRVNTHGVPDPLAKAIARFFVAIGRGDRLFFAQKPYAPGERFEDACCTSPARFAYYADLRRETPALRTNGSSYRWILEALRSGDRLLQPENLARIRTPALVIRAELDDLVRPDGQDAFVRGVPCARLVTIRGVKHEIYRSKNDQLLPYLETIFRFLEEE